MIAAWNDLGSSTAAVREVERRVAEDDEQGPALLVHVLAALDIAARRVGGTMANARNSVQATEVDACLHHLLELLHHAGLRAAVAAAERLDAPTRAQALATLRSYWQAPHQALTQPLDDTHVMLRKGPFRF